MSRGAAYQKSRPLPASDTPRETPVAAWLHWGQDSPGTVAVTIPGTHKAISFTRTQVGKLRRAFAAADDIFARGEAPDARTSIDLMKRISE